MIVDAFVIYAVLAKWLLYATTFGAVGTFIFQRLFLQEGSGIWARCWRLIIACTITSLIATLLHFSASAMMLTGDIQGAFDSSILGILWQGPSGDVVRIRSVGCVFLLIAYFLNRWQFVTAIFGCALMLLSFCLIGHVTKVVSPIGTIILLTHIFAVSYWVGSFIPLYWLSRGNDINKAARISQRFGGMALFFIPLLIAAGVIYSYFLLGSVAALLHTSYGQILLVKIVIVSCILSFAALNKLRFVPLMLQGQEKGALYLGRSIMFEGVLVLVVFLITAVLTTTVQLD